MQQYEKQVLKLIEESIQVKRTLQEKSAIIADIADKIIEAVQRGNKVVAFGNGGSAADAQHIVSELSGRFYKDRPPIPAIALTTNTSTLTAIGNDYGYDEIFARQVTGLVKKGDIAIGISTSGESVNVIRGILEAKRLGAITIALTGESGKLADLADQALRIPSRDTPRIQEAHILVGHIICFLVEEALFGNNKGE